MTTQTFTGNAEAASDYWMPEAAKVPVLRAMTADGAPMAPPRSWFADPGFNHLTPLEITADGQVRGHIAAWHQSHIGMAGKIKPPRSRSGYAFFATGALLTEEGELVDVGQITLNGGHADLNIDVPQAVAHYDNPESGVADVSVGEDRYGIWAAGALRPDVDDLRVRKLRASGVSGDWRPINGNLELVAVCSVNVPGFPIPRARVASGHVYALVAAGIEPIVDEQIKALTAAAVIEALDAVHDRLSLVESTIPDLPKARRRALRSTRPTRPTRPKRTPVLTASGQPVPRIVKTTEDLALALTASVITPTRQRYLRACATRLETGVAVDRMRARVRPIVAATDDPREALRQRILAGT